MPNRPTPAEVRKAQEHKKYRMMYTKAYGYPLFIKYAMYEWGPSVRNVQLDHYRIKF